MLKGFKRRLKTEISWHIYRHMTENFSNLTLNSTETIKYIIHQKYLAM